LSKNRHAIAYKWMVMFVIALGTLMSTTDMGGTRVVLPHLEQVLETSPDVVVWVSLIWVLVGSSLMLSMGRAADIFGRKRLYTLGFAIFIVGLALCSISQNIIQLVIFRFIQSIGAAMTIAIGSAILTTSFPTSERGKALGIMGAVGGLGMLSGPALGGLCLDLLGWRSFFYLRIPFVLIGLVMVHILLKKEPAHESKEKFDLPGAITFFLALICLLFVLTQGQRLGWSSPWMIGLSCAGILFLISFLFVEKRISQPMLDLKIFRSRLFSIAVVSHIFLYVSTTAVNFAMPFYLIAGLGFNASKAGLLLVTVPATALIFSPLSGRLSDKLGTLVLCTAGFILTALGLFLLSGATIDTSIITVVLYLILVGAGMGLFVSPNTSAIIGAVPSGRLGSASAMVGTLRHIGMSIGLAIAGSVFTATRFANAAQLTSDGLTQGLVGKLSTVGGFQNTIFVALITAAIGLLVSAFRGRISPKS
jgi:EmrB/QacA subfamily drug resistance transporter